MKRGRQGVWASVVAAPGLQSSGSVAVVHGLSCSATCGIVPDQGRNWVFLHWQANSSPLNHQGNPATMILDGTLSSFLFFLCRSFTVRSPKEQFCPHQLPAGGYPVWNQFPHEFLKLKFPCHSVGRGAGDMLVLSTPFGSSNGNSFFFFFHLVVVVAESRSRVRLFRPHGLQSTRLLHPWDSPGKNTRVGCHVLLHLEPLAEKVSFITSLDQWAELFSSSAGNGQFFQNPVCLPIQSPSRGQLFAAPWTADCQAPWPMRFPSQECWIGVPFPSPGQSP